MPKSYKRTKILIWFTTYIYQCIFNLYILSFMCETYLFVYPRTSSSIFLNLGLFTFNHFRLIWIPLFLNHFIQKSLYLSLLFPPLFLSKNLSSHNVSGQNLTSWQPSWSVKVHHSTAHENKAGTTVEIRYSPSPDALFVTHGILSPPWL